MVVEALLPGTASVVVLLALAVLLIVEPLASLALALTTRVKVALAPATRGGSAAVACARPWSESVGAVPEASLAETNVSPAGRASVRLTPWASEGPLFVKVSV